MIPVPNPEILNCLKAMLSSMLNIVVKNHCS